MIDELLPSVRTTSFGDSTYDDKDIKKELQRRCFLVGNAPRYVFDDASFRQHCRSIKRQVESTAQQLKLSDLLSIYRLSTRTGNADASFYSSKVYELHASLEYPMESWPLLVNLASSLLADKLASGESSFDEDDNTKEFEKITGEILKRGGSLPDQMACVLRNFDQNLETEKLYHAIRTLGRDKFVALNLIHNFPVADFAIGPNQVVNAKSGKAGFKSSTVVNFMKNLGLRQLTIYVATPTGNVVDKILKTSETEADEILREVDDFRNDVEENVYQVKFLFIAMLPLMDDDERKMDIDDKQMMEDLETYDGDGNLVLPNGFHQRLQYLRLLRKHFGKVHRGRSSNGL